MGPELERLTRRLAETPPDFLDEPHIGRTGTVHVAALVNDVLLRLGGRAAPDALGAFAGRDARADRNRLSLCAVVCWLLGDDWFAGAAPAQAEVLALMREAMEELAQRSPAPQFVNQPDRREELVRMALARLGYRPAGETEAQAADRLSAVSSVERERLRAASRAAEQRAREIREALARKAAQESADKWTRD